MKTVLLALRNEHIKRAIIRYVVRPLDVLLAPFTLFAAALLKSLRRVGVYRLPVSHSIFRALGIFPIRDHYYEPLFHPRHLIRRLDDERPLPALEMNIEGQLNLISKFDFTDELASIPWDGSEGSYFYNNANFSVGDSEFLYSVIRHFKPKRILEIGSGFSTLLMLRAIKRNRELDPNYRCRPICIEPHEMAWLDRISDVEVLRSPVERLPSKYVLDLAENDILFIDSSHVIRPQGDVVRLYLELLPRLAKGVLVHVHDIFTPRDYPRRWVVDEVRLYSEQYLLEAFLSFNHDFRVLGALNVLAHHHPETLMEKFPAFRRCPDSEPSSIWLTRI